VAKGYGDKEGSTKEVGAKKLFGEKGGADPSQGKSPDPPTTLVNWPSTVVLVPGHALSGGPEHLAWSKKNFLHILLELVVHDNDKLRPRYSRIAPPTSANATAINATRSFPPTITIRNASDLLHKTQCSQQ
jgi:hypothetical protein